MTHLAHIHECMTAHPELFLPVVIDDDSSDSDDSDESSLDVDHSNKVSLGVDHSSESLGVDHSNEVSYIDHHNRFATALFLAFDVPKTCSTLKYEICNRDLLWIPTNRSKKSLKNYFQLASEDTDERDPIDETVSYLFSECEPHYREPYDFSDVEDAERKMFYTHILERYANPTVYLHRVSTMLWKNENALRGYHDTIAHVWNTEE